MTGSDSFDAIVLAGGRARRLAGTDKPGHRVGGRRLIDIALAAVDSAESIVVVGPPRALPARVLQTREDPPYAGPAPAVAAGLTALAAARPDATDDRLVAVIASDLPELTAAAITRLREHAVVTGAPAVFATDETGHRQYLFGVWRRDALRRALADADGPSMRALTPAGAQSIPLDGTTDVDTPEELSAARRRALPERLDPMAARERLRTALTPVAVRTARLDDAAGAVLAAPLLAAADFPPFDASAMDGYAVAGPSPWTLIDAPAAAGPAGGPSLAAGHTVRIATGAALPAGAERVIRFEEVSVDGDLVTETSRDRDDTRRRGSAWPAGTVLAATGTGVDAALQSVARSAGVAQAAVRGPLTVRLHTSGDEIVPGPLGGSLAPGQLPDTASAPVAALLTGAGLQVQPGGHLRDTPGAFAAALRAPVTDLVVIIGATGHGIADRLRTALHDADAEILIDGVLLRPGGSLLVARLSGGAVLLGLGGNPLAAVAGAALLLPPIRATLTDAAPAAPEVLALADPAARQVDRHWRVLPVEPDGTGGWHATVGRGTGHLASAIGFRGLALVPPAGSPEPVERLV